MDYSLLRPFDLEAAKAGEELVCSHDGSLRKYVAGPDTEDKIIVTDANGVFQKSEYYREHYAMAPLAWVEGKPVYKGDVLYHSGMGQKVTAKAPSDGLHIVSYFELDGCVETSISALTWNAPKVKREGWVAIKLTTRPSANHLAFCSHVCATKIAAEGYYGPEKVAVVCVEWEE